MSEVAAAPGQPEEALIADMKTLMVTIGDLKADMLRMLDEDANRSGCFRATRAEAARLARAVDELEARLGRVIDRAKCEVLPEVNARLAEYPKVVEQLRCAELVHRAMSVISEIQRRMAALQSLSKQGRYLDCVDEVVALDELFRRDLQLAKEDVQVLRMLRNLFITCKHGLHDAFLAMWASNFVFKEKLEKPLVCSLTVANLSEAPKLVRAFQALKLFHSKVDAQLAHTLLNRFLLPVIADSGLLLECNSVNNQLELVLVDALQDGSDGQAATPSTADGGAQRRPPPSPVALSMALQPTLATLQDCLLSLPLTMPSAAPASEEAGGPETLADRLRPLIEEPLAQRLVSDCLAKTVPTDWAGLQSYGETATAVEQLERQLVSECRLVSPSVSRLSDFVRDIRAVFAEQRVAALLEGGRSIAARSLADSVLLDLAADDAEAAGNAATEKEQEEAEDAKEAAASDRDLVEKYIDRRAFTFPACHVSRSAVALADYIAEACRAIADEVHRDDRDDKSHREEEEEEAAALFGSELRRRVGLCCRKLLLLYRDVAANANAEQLAEVPQLAALYYNSCHYLAYCAVDFEHRFVGPLLSGGSGDQQQQQPQPPKCLVDVAASLRSEGARVFLSQLARQRQLVLEPLTQLALGQQAAGGSYEANSRLCRQSIYQLECLGRVWSVLPAKIRYKALGALTHCLLSALATFALAQEDFDCRDADDLARLFDAARDRVVAVFDGNAAAAERHSPSWRRFCLLGRMLSAPLAAFPDLWCDGKSLLAAAFTDAEVRGLVKALFSNTDDRAAVLAKIN